jgi:hypothetical protein
MFTRDGLIDMLRHNIVTVTFTKVNGDERIMKCTLRGEMIPNAPTQNGELVIEQKAKSNNVAVWDIEANGWRSFKVENVKNISIG